MTIRETASSTDGLPLPVVSLEQHQAYFDSLREAVGFLHPVRDTEGRITTFVSLGANRAMHDALGLAQVRGLTVEAIHGPRAAERNQLFRRVLETGVPEEYPQVFGGRENIARVFRIDDALIGITMVDVTAEQHAARELARTVARATEQAADLRAVLDAMPAVVFTLRAGEGKTLYRNRFADELLRLPARGPEADDDRPPFHGPLRKFRDGIAVAPDDTDIHRAARLGESIRDAEVDVALDDGTVVHLLGNAEPLRAADGSVRGAVSAYVDITARKLGARTLAAALARFDSFMAATPALAWVKDAEGRIVYVNAMWERALGITLAQVRGRSVNELRPEITVPQMQESELAVLRTGESSSEVVPWVDASTGWQRWWHVVRFAVDDGSGGRLLGGLATDITDQREVEDALRTSEATALAALEDLEAALAETHRTQEKLRQSQKMEAIGQLAGGVAHDFNNLLTVILGNGELIEEVLGDDPLQSEVRQILSAAERAATLTRQLLAFSRKQALEPRVLNVNTILRGMEPMLRRLLAEDVEFAFLLAPEPHLCLVDAGQIEQVVLNLVVNARDAMPEGGRLTIETANVSFDADYVERHPETMIGPHLMLSISDTGTGMDAETQARLFEPFFTTKPVGRGTGLGLSTVYGIVKQTGGSIWVYSEPGHGTTFKVYLPESRGVEDDLPVKPASRQSYSGTETILLAEDDAQVRATVAGMLRRAGYHVIEASNGGEALLICEQHGGGIAMLVTDVVMPRMNGRQLAARLQAIRPEMLVLFISGYTENVVVHHGVVDSGVNFLQKPLTAETLLPKVRQVLDRGAAAR